MAETIPENVNVLPNGAWQNKETGKIVRASQQNLWDSKKASEMAKRRHAKMKEATAEGITEAVQEHGHKAIQEFPEAHKEVTKALMTEVVLNSQARGSDRTKTYESLLSMEGSMGNVRRPESEQAGLTISFSPEIARHLIEGAMAWKQKQDGDVVDAEFKVVEDE